MRGYEKAKQEACRNMGGETSSLRRNTDGDSFKQLSNQTAEVHTAKALRFPHGREERDIVLATNNGFVGFLDQAAAPSRRLQFLCPNGNARCLRIAAEDQSGR
jgi:hypothetical protein